MFEKMNFDYWSSVVKPKIQGTWNLHKLLPQGMDFFITLASMIGVLGNASQANYAAGSTYQDALVRHRIANGENATSLDLGPLLGIGQLAESEDLRAKVEQTKHFTMLSPDDLNAMLEYYCKKPTSATAALLNCQAISGIKVPAQIRASAQEVPVWMRRPMFKYLSQLGATDLTAAPRDAKEDDTPDLSTQLASASTLTDAGVAVTEALIKRLARILATSVENFDLQKSMHSYGMDSLMAVDVRNWFLREMKADVSIFDIMGSSSLENMGAMAATRSPFFVSTAS